MPIEELPVSMRTFTGQMILYGKITIPKEIRRLTGIKPGDTVNLVIVSVAREDGQPRRIEHIPAKQRTFSRTVPKDMRITIPSKIRALLGIHEGDYVTMTINHVIRGDSGAVQKV